MEKVNINIRKHSTTKRISVYKIRAKYVNKGNKDSNTKDYVTSENTNLESYTCIGIIAPPLTSRQGQKQSKSLRKMERNAVAGFEQTPSSFTVPCTTTELTADHECHLYSANI